MTEAGVEERRIVAEYERRDRRLAARYAPDSSAEVFLRRRRRRAVAHALGEEASRPLAGKGVLDVGCGAGRGLADLAALGAERIAGIDLVAARADAAREWMASRPGGLAVDVRRGNAVDLPWADGAFDVVHQCMTLSSIVSSGQRAVAAAEMARVLAPRGIVLSIDFRLDNPRNRAVRGVGRRELAALFPGFELQCRSVALPPPLTRLLLPRGRALAELIEGTRLLNSQLLVVLRRKAA